MLCRYCANTSLARYAVFVAAQPHWHRRLPAIRAELATLETPSLDRALIEQLFGFSRRQAIRLMATIEKPRPGIATVIARDRLLATLDRLLATKPVQHEIARKRQLQDQLAAIEREALSKAALITPPPPRAGPGNEVAWPHGITHDVPGILTIGFGSAEELLGRVLALTEDAAGNYEAFRARLLPGEQNLP